MSTYFANVSGQTFGTQTRGFVYDELNRLTSSQVDGSANYQTSYTYDANGNITNLTRNDQSGAAMDNLTYRYATDGSGKILNNRLLHVNDDVQNSANPSDIENQGDNYAQYDPASHNYAYDKMGNLIKDQSEEIAEITWNTAGKVSKVSRIEGSGKPDL
jgi:RHS Repeat.